MFKEQMCLIVTIVATGFATEVVEASKNAGADGATILSGRGTSIHENTKIMGVQIQPEKDVVFSLIKKSIRKKVMKEIVRVCNLNTSGKGITFCLPVDEFAGAPHLFKKHKKEDLKKDKEKAQKEASKKE